jgi:hypothetical protein
MGSFQGVGPGGVFNLPVAGSIWLFGLFGSAGRVRWPQLFVRLPQLAHPVSLRFTKVISDPPKPASSHAPTHQDPGKLRIQSLEILFFMLLLEPKWIFSEYDKSAPLGSDSPRDMRH